MPTRNFFQHQQYLDETPAVSVELLRAPEPTTPGSAAFDEQLAVLGERLRTAGVTTVFLIHGTFVGNDALGLVREVSRVWPAAGKWLANVGKQASDRIAADSGNYTPDFTEQFEQCINATEGPPISVKMLNWSSENHHIGRADGAVRLIESLAELPEGNSRVLIFAHSHGGNLLALATNLLAADEATRKKFFHAGRSYYRWPIWHRVDMPHWPRVAEILNLPHHPLRDLSLDLVTFGCPIRYGWDNDGFTKLLHFVNHSPVENTPPERVRFPFSADELISGEHGDYIHQLGVAGTNFSPAITQWRAWLADRRLHRLLQHGIRKRDLLARLRLGLRVHEDGATLLVDYGPDDTHPARKVAGHTIYTRAEWLCFQLEQVAERFYPVAPSPPPGRGLG